MAKAILLVEDNPGDIFLIQEALREHGVDRAVIVVRDGQEAIDFIDTLQAHGSRCVGLVILDVNLPRRNGFEVLTRIRATPVCRHAFVAVFSSSDADKDRAEMKARGADAYFRKPARLESFLDFGGKVREIIEGLASN